MYEPKQTKYRKAFRGKMGGTASANNEVAFGEYGLKSLDRGWVNARELEAARKAIVGHIKRKGKVWIKVFPHKPVTQKANNSKMGSGKGEVEEYVTVVKPGSILFEISGVKPEIAESAFRLASHKLSVRTKFVKKKDF